MQQSRKKQILTEIKHYKSLSLKEKELYVKSSYELQNEVEETFRSFFSEDEDIANEYIEQIREQSMLSNIGINDLAAIPVSRKITYETARVISKALDGKNPKDVMQSIKAARKKKKAVLTDSEGEFMGFMRSYSKYWTQKIDENDAEIEEGDLSWLENQVSF